MHVVGVVALVAGLLAVEGVVSEVRVVAVEVGVEAVVSDVKLVGSSSRCGSSSSTRGRSTGNGSICIPYALVVVDRPHAKSWFSPISAIWRRRRRG